MGVKARLERVSTKVWESMSQLLNNHKETILCRRNNNEAVEEPTPKTSALAEIILICPVFHLAVKHFTVDTVRASALGDSGRITVESSNGSYSERDEPA
ncbi:hypothetical protein TNCT_357621 [Trichonephila clavata]|uniref:Uncharacterized protein n=1 Tax=Trichonephila clavata TaxID=2740835 RepID=A0A8X6I145_TRICU|nr:hypothetical protein TNCT_357621 [Trichonephila clavata]